jgi:glycosyltransferase involved in cell wall biosynthesis
LKQNKKHKILLGFSEVAGYQANLFEGLISQNYIVGYINNDNMKFDYKINQSRNHPRLNKYNSFCKRAINNPTLVNKVSFVLYTTFILFFVAIYYDVFIINKFSLLYQFDIKLLKFFDKKIIFISLGSDTRPPYLNGKYKDDERNQEFNLSKILRATKKIRNKVEFVEKNVDIFINYPQHGHFNSKPFINGMYIGFPTNNREDQVITITKTNSKLKILHAPSRPRSKGSIFIKEIVKSLQQEGLNIELVELTNVSNDKVIDLLKKCDIVFDEVYSDMPLGGLGTEAAQFSKPVIVGGYYSNFFKEYDSKIIPPSIYVHPDELKSNLKNLCLDKDKRIQTGKDLNIFVNSMWSCKVVAKRYLDLINNQYDNKWIFEPKMISHFNGWGLSEAEMLENLKKIIKKPGEALNFGISNLEVLKKLKKLII